MLAVNIKLIISVPTLSARSDVKLIFLERHMIHLVERAYCFGRAGCSIMRKKVLL